MNVDDLLFRHRPADRLHADERAALLAALIEPDPEHSGSSGGVITIIGDRGSVSRPRRPWLAAGAAAALIVVCAGGLVAWRSSVFDDTPVPSGDHVSAVCAGTLPASWRAARSDTPLRVDGHNAVPHATTAAGVQVLSWDPTPTEVDFGLRATDGEITPVATFPAGDSGGPAVYGTDGHRVVFGLSADEKVTDDIQLVDAATHSRVHLLRGAPVPHGWVVGNDIALTDGFVYWGATPSAGDDSRGVVIRYSLADGSYRVLAHLDRSPTVAADVRGVAWPTGWVRSADVPEALNPILDANGDPVDRLVTDGSTYAWQLIHGDQTIFHWADSAGATRSFRIAAGPGQDGFGLTGVSGPFMFFHQNTAQDAESVLDTRTGALAVADLDNEIVSAPGKHLFAIAGGYEYHEVDASALSGFGCG